VHSGSTRHLKILPQGFSDVNGRDPSSRHSANTSFK